VLYQSRRSDAYHEALHQLASQQLSYHCTCSRQAVQSQSPETVYGGHCRHLNYGKETISAIRLNIEKSLQILDLNPLMTFDDLFQGTRQHNLFSEVGDFVIHRKDGFFAYQLAVVVDDIFQNITHIIRGADLLDSTARQLLLFKLLRPVNVNSSLLPVFGHVPLVTNSAGQKLSKQNRAAALNDLSPEKNIFSALQYLNQQPPPALAQEPLQTLLHWAIANWKITAARQS
jgi:glutamyl-Q tRNA(Asp) synthetase